MSNGWPRKSARIALSRAAMKSGLVPLFSTCGRAASVPSGLNLTGPGRPVPADPWRRRADSTVAPAARAARRARSATSAPHRLGQAERGRVVERVSGRRQAGRRRACRAAPRPVWGRTSVRAAQASSAAPEAWLRLFSARASCFRPSSKPRRSDRAWFRPASSRAWPRPASLPAPVAARATAFTSFLSTFAVGSSTGFGSRDLLDQRLRRLRLGRALVAGRDLGEVGHGHDIDRQRLARRHGQRLGGERPHAPQQHGRVPDPRYGVGRSSCPRFHAISAPNPARSPSPAPRGGSPPPISAPSPSSPCRSRPACRHARRCARPPRPAPR